MKFKNLKHILIAVTAVALMTGTALASGFTRSIQANYVGVKLVVNGVEVNPTDAAGNPVEPFICEGTTYLPVRAVAEALGEEVSWDGETKTVSIGKAVSPETIPYQVNDGTLYDGTKLDSTFSVAGKKYNAGVVLRSVHAYWEYIKSDRADFDGSAIWNTEGYQTMTFTVGHVGDKQRNGTLYVSLNGVAAGEYPLTWDGAPQTITVPLGSSANVKLTLVVPEVVESTSHDWSRVATSLAESYGIYNVTLS